MTNNRIDGVIIVIALVFCGLLFWQNPPTETRQASKLVRDPVTGIEVSGRAVIMISKQGCAPCEQLKRETLPEAREAGYETTIVEQPSERYPTTRIFDGKRWQTRFGFFRWGR
jgi:thioredoxin-related protein